jgi:hypothetical protein
VQYLLMLVMNPTLPAAPGTLYHLVVSTDGLVLVLGQEEDKNKNKKNDKVLCITRSGMRVRVRVKMWVREKKGRVGLGTVAIWGIRSKIQGRRNKTLFLPPSHHITQTHMHNSSLQLSYRVDLPHSSALSPAALPATHTNTGEKWNEES